MTATEFVKARAPAHCPQCVSLRRLGTAGKPFFWRTRLTSWKWSELPRERLDGGLLPGFDRRRGRPTEPTASDASPESRCSLLQAGSTGFGPPPADESTESPDPPLLSSWNGQGRNLNRVVAARPDAGRTEVFLGGDPGSRLPGVSVLPDRVKEFLDRAQE